MAKFKCYFPFNYTWKHWNIGRIFFSRKKI